MPFSRRIALLAGAAALAGLARPAFAQDQTPAIRVGTLENGTVAWEIETIRRGGLDIANGFRLVPMILAGNPATQVAMQGAEVDTIVSDWLWVAQQRARGTGFRFLPYSTAVGGVMVPADSPVQTLADLHGKKIGIAGGPVDKSWLILRAWSREKLGADLAEVTQQVFGAPPMILNAAETGEVDAAINFWHFQARMQARGMREIMSVETAAGDLGLDPSTPLLGYVLRDDWIAANPALAAGLARASRAAKDLLARDDAAWDALRPIMEAADDAEFEALKAGWRAGIPAPGPVDAANAQKMFATMAELGGEELTGGLATLPEGLFWWPE
ncbi:ABC transporter substrate-binding protein [Paracoccus sp. APAP_BH8]|uniref:ABC transporter substrate-binding protein n=1 Tax=Paracoccus TaxID=265 RepID=UPI00048C4F77|nr:ABC transporter substrate-binding protein [Paracoccus pantotrophus]MDF3855884.1 ABC transporter substrate-binding protein [Paracoccus pantotrophus]RDE00830.1 ABC transporter substrate-binding protein [Paracoccus pantotrophus]RNI20201.1 ABC transporter substrate-binding protein [Paracoccus pantotrophus]WGR63897.1 ABC transporter substrate-binding protein [Paracoccus pantotrophus]SFO84800.1 NitT/TauT family transport system substrate-binding protein [Paracoccus pantotrophus]